MIVNTWQFQSCQAKWVKNFLESWELKTIYLPSYAPEFATAKLMFSVKRRIRSKLENVSKFMSYEGL